MQGDSEVMATDQTLSSQMNYGVISWVLYAQLKNSSIMPWQSSSIRPSFLDFFQHTYINLKLGKIIQ